MLSSATIARPGRHASAVLSNVARTRAGPSHFHYPCASAYNNILLRRPYTTPPPTPSSSSASSAANPRTDAPPPPRQSEGSAASQKKPKLDMRPGPVKPKPPSDTSTASGPATKAKSKAHAADPLKASAPPTRKSTSNMKQLKSKSPYYAEKEKEEEKTAASSNPDTTAKEEKEKTASSNSDTTVEEKEKTAASSNSDTTAKDAESPPPPPPSSSATSTDAPLSGLKAAKAEVMQAIKEAEEHGILKPPPEGANGLRRTYHHAKELAKFYFRGIKLIWQRRKIVQDIRNRVIEKGERITRAEFRLAETQSEDVGKLAPFVLIAIILEEVIPLIAIYAPGMLPSTCILPSQRRSIEAKRAAKAEAFRAQYAPVFGALKALAEMRTLERQVLRDGRPLMYLVIEPATLEHVKDAPIALCGLLGLSTFGPDILRVRRIKNRLMFLMADDILLVAEKTKAEMLSEQDLSEALAERGIPKPPDATRTQLNTLFDGWLTQSKLVSDGDDDARRLALILTHA